MVQKYELLTNDEIINNYKNLKEKERVKNKIYYEGLKLNKVKYRKRLTDALEKQNEKIALLKEDDVKYNEYKTKHNIIQKLAYYNKKIKELQNNFNTLVINDSNIILDED